MISTTISSKVLHTRDDIYEVFSIDMSFNDDHVESKAIQFSTLQRAEIQCFNVDEHGKLMLESDDWQFLSSKRDYVESSNPFDEILGGVELCNLAKSKYRAKEVHASFYINIAMQHSGYETFGKTRSINNVETEEGFAILSNEMAIRIKPEKLSVAFEFLVSEFPELSNLAKGFTGQYPTAKREKAALEPSKPKYESWGNW